MIKLREVSKEYKIGNNIITALCDVNLDIENGEFLGVLGHSGSGKTTLMNKSIKFINGQKSHFICLLSPHAASLSARIVGKVIKLDSIIEYRTKLIIDSMQICFRIRLAVLFA